MARPNEARPPPSQSAEGGSDRICIARSAPRVYAGAKDRNARGTWSLGRRGFAGSSARTRRRTHAPRTSTDAHQCSTRCCGESHRFIKVVLHFRQSRVNAFFALRGRGRQLAAAVLRFQHRRGPTHHLFSGPMGLLSRVRPSAPSRRARVGSKGCRQAVEQ